MLHCPKCNDDKPNNQFPAIESHGDYRCCDCIRRGHKAWRDKNPKKMHQAYLRAKQRTLTFGGYYARMAGNARQRAQAGNYPCSITTEFLRELHAKQRGQCALSGIEFTISRRGHKESAPFNPSLDKIEPARGYVPNNVRLVCHWVNVMKYCFTDEQLFEMCQTILNHKNY